MQHRKHIDQIAVFESFCKKNKIDNKDIIASIGGIDLNLKVASTNLSKSKGFTGLNEPIENNGILFTYEYEDILGFWMKNVPFKLDILFFNANLDMVNGFTMEEYDNRDPNIIYNSGVPAQYAVELKSGWIDKNIINNKNVKLKF